LAGLVATAAPTPINCNSTTSSPATASGNCHTVCISVACSEWRRVLRPFRNAEFKGTLKEPAARARTDEAPGSPTGEGISGNAVSPYEFGGNDMSTQTLLLSLSGARGRRTVGSRELLCTDALWVPDAVDHGGAGEWESISTPAALAERAECCNAWTEITEGDLSQQLHFMRWPGICRPEPPYDTYVSGSDSDDGFDDFPDVDGWSFGFGT
jgi:hypothetical protein